MVAGLDGEPIREVNRGGKATSVEVIDWARSSTVNESKDFDARSSAETIKS